MFVLGTVLNLIIIKQVSCSFSFCNASYAGVTFCDPVHSQEQRATELNNRNIADKQLFSKMIREILQLKKSGKRRQAGSL
ncbi:hypothetical protein T08_4737 [Trichinella sp. T8]|nr:hypothetical protein T08_4737 [Trichinella sp. T8]